MSDGSKAPEPISPEYRVRRAPRYVQPAENLPISELESHYKRLCRVGEENLWKKGFGLLAVILLGGVVGAALAGPGWTWEVKAAAVVTVVAGLAWKGIADTESEGIKTIRDDYKRDILDSLVLEPVDGQDITLVSRPLRRKISTRSSRALLTSSRNLQNRISLSARHTRKVNRSGFGSLTPGSFSLRFRG